MKICSLLCTATLPICFNIRDGFLRKSRALIRTLNRTDKIIPLFCADSPLNRSSKTIARTIGAMFTEHTASTTNDSAPTSVNCTKKPALEEAHFASNDTGSSDTDVCDSHRAILPLSASAYSGQTQERLCPSTQALNQCH